MSITEIAVFLNAFILLQIRPWSRSLVQCLHKSMFYFSSMSKVALRKPVTCLQCTLLSLKVMRGRNICGSMQINTLILENQSKWHSLLANNSMQRMSMFKCFINYKKINLHLLTYFLLKISVLDNIAWFYPASISPKGDKQQFKLRSLGQDWKNWSFPSFIKLSTLWGEPLFVTLFFLMPSKVLARAYSVVRVYKPEEQKIHFNYIFAISSVQIFPILWPSFFLSFWHL